MSSLGLFIFDDPYPIGYHIQSFIKDYYQNVIGLEIIRPNHYIPIRKPRSYLIPWYIKSNEMYWEPNIKMMRRICRKLKIK